MQAMKALSRTLFAAYLLILLWLVLFKLSYDPIGVIRGFQTRSLNLIPFAYANKSEVIANLIAFIPFGVMLSVNFRGLVFKNKIAIIFVFSLAFEIIQYVLAIGAADVTDVIMNTFGGFVGLSAYTFASRQTDDRTLNLGITLSGTLILLAILYLRIFVFIVRY